MRLAKLLVLIAVFFLAYFTRVPEVMVEEGDGSFELRSGNLVAGTLIILFLPVFILSLAALYHTLRKDPCLRTVRLGRYLAFALTLSAHLLALHIGEWNAVFNPAVILADPSEAFALRAFSSAMAFFFLASTLPPLLSFLGAGRTGRKPWARPSP